MELFIMRHAIAEEVSATGRDEDRVLTDEGKERTRLAASAFKRLAIKFDRILSSPYSRAWETASILAAGLQMEKHLVRFPALASGADALKLLYELAHHARKDAHLLLVGHEPDLSRLISVCLAGDGSIDVQMKKGAIAKIAFVSLPAPAQGTLEWLLAPKQLVALGSGE